MTKQSYNPYFRSDFQCVDHFQKTKYSCSDLYYIHCADTNKIQTYISLYIYTLFCSYHIQYTSNKRWQKMITEPIFIYPRPCYLFKFSSLEILIDKLLKPAFLLLSFTPLCRKYWITSVCGAICSKTWSVGWHASPFSALGQWVQPLCPSSLSLSWGLNLFIYMAVLCL